MIRIVLFVLLLGLPIAEIAVFMMVGSVIGILPTIVLIVATALLGAFLLKRQGISALARLQKDLREDKVPAAALGETVTIAIAGVLLLTPGFITDVVGFALFVPAVRRWLWHRIAGSATIVSAEGMSFRQYSSASAGAGAGPRSRGERTIDLDETEFSHTDETSPWREPPKE